jgi:hypothetical protein
MPKIIICDSEGDNEKLLAALREAFPDDVSVCSDAVKVISEREYFPVPKVYLPGFQKKARRRGQRRSRGG